jgi:hypothetical protein
LLFRHTKAPFLFKVLIASLVNSFAVILQN